MKKLICLCVVAMVLSGCGSNVEEETPSSTTVLSSIESLAREIPTNIHMVKIEIPEEPEWPDGVPTCEGAVGVTKDGLTAKWVGDDNWFMLESDSYWLLYDMDKTFYVHSGDKTYKYIPSDALTFSVNIEFDWIDLDEWLTIYSNVHEDLLSNYEPKFDTELKSNVAVYRDRLIFYDDDLRITAVNSAEFLYEPESLPDYSNAWTGEYSTILKILESEK